MGDGSLQPYEFLVLNEMVLGRSPEEKRGFLFVCLFNTKVRLSFSIRFCIKIRRDETRGKVIDLGNS